MSKNDGRFETQVIHAGQKHEPITGAVMTPVFQTSTYAQPWPARHTGYEYARTQNPTREALEGCVAALEGGTHGIAFGSGLAATTTVMHMLKAGHRRLTWRGLFESHANGAAFNHPCGQVALRFRKFSHAPPIPVAFAVTPHFQPRLDQAYLLKDQPLLPQLFAIDGNDRFLQIQNG